MTLELTWKFYLARRSTAFMVVYFEFIHRYATWPWRGPIPIVCLIKSNHGRQWRIREAQWITLLSQVLILWCSYKTFLLVFWQATLGCKSHSIQGQIQLPGWIKNIIEYYLCKIVGTWLLSWISIFGSPNFCFKSCLLEAKFPIIVAMLAFLSEWRLGI